MLYNYEQKYNVLERFEHNDYQNILMGVDKTNPDEVVVINLFKKSLMIHSNLADLFKSHLSSLVMLEETDEELIVITKYHEGMPLKNYLENYDTTLKHRINFAYEFLKKISIYNDFSYYFMRLFIDEDQIIMKNDTLLLNELLVLDQPDEMATATFHSVCQKIGHILDNIVSAADDESAKTSILDFIETLKTDHHTYTNLDEIHDAFKKIYIYDMYLDDDASSDDSDRMTTTTFVGGAIKETEEVDSAEDEVDWEDDLRSAFGRSPIEEPSFDDSDEEDEDLEDDIEEEVEAFEPEPVWPAEPEWPTEPEQAITEEPKPLNLEKEVKEEPVEPVWSDTPEAEEPQGADMISSEDADENEEDFLSDEEEEQLQAIFAKNAHDKEPKEPSNKKRSGLMWILLAAAIIILGIFGVNACQDKMIKTQEKPVAHIVKTRIGDSYYFENKTEFPGETSASRTEWKFFKEDELQSMEDSYDLTITLDEDGKYRVELRVMNDQGVWSDPEIHEFYHVSISSENGDTPNIIKTEKMDNYTIQFNDPNITRDETVYRNGSYSIKLDFDAEDEATDEPQTDSNSGKRYESFVRSKTAARPKSKSFTIQDTFLDDKAIVSLWIRSSQTNPISIRFIGYNNKNIVFTKDITHNPPTANTWNMEQFKVEVDKVVDSIEVTVTTTGGQVWLDDFSINSFK